MKAAHSHKVRRTLEQLDQWADARERFLGIDLERRKRLSFKDRRALRAAILEEEAARRAFEQSAEGKRHQALENQRIEVLAEIEAVEAGDTAQKHRRLEELEGQLKRIKEEIQKIEAKPLRETSEQRAVRIAKRLQTLRGSGARNCLQVVAREEGISTSRVKQLEKRGRLVGSRRNRSR
jgi:hypothetical protein